MYGMPSSKKKYLIWDFDGTLAWRPGGWTGAVITVLRHSAAEVKATAEQVRPYLQSGFPWHAPENSHPGISPSEWWEDLHPVFMRAFKGVGVKNGQCMELAREVRKAYIDPVGWQRYNDSLTALELLSARGWKHILLSNHVPELPILLERLSLSDYFIAVFNSAETGYEKPNPKAFRNVLDWLEPGASVWMVGDNYASDILGAAEIGLPGILVRKPHPDAPIFCATLPEISEKL
jgi:putative hydrolase of the HAD superfamily